MGTTTIDWTTTTNADGSKTKGRVWNPVTGCTKISAGCKNCYAASIAKRFWGDRDFGDIQTHYNRLDDPGKWRAPARVFVDSMSDLFHELVPFNFIATVFYRMGQYDQHTYVVLTKRPARMLEFFGAWKEYIEQAKQEGIPFFAPPLANVWLGVSVENQKEADARIPLLLKAPAAVRVVSVEPMLEEIDLYKAAGLPGWLAPQFSWKTGTGINWVICGSESGTGKRPFEMDWARSLRDQCQAAGVKFFFKQAPVAGKVVKMPGLDGKVWDEVPNG